MVLIIFVVIFSFITCILLKYSKSIKITKYVGWVGDRYKIEDIFCNSQLEDIRKKT